MKLYIMKRIMRNHSLLMMLFMLAVVSSAAAGPLRFKHIEAGDGLSNNKVNSILKDKEGFMWFGTSSGLNRYDGYNIKVYRGDPTDSTALNDSYIDRLLQDDNGRIWIHMGDSYSVYDPVHDRFDNNVLPEFRKMGINAIPSYMNILPTGIWMNVRNDGLYRYKNGRTDKMTPLSSDGREITGVTAMKDSMTAVIDNRGRISIIDSDLAVVASVETFGVNDPHQENMWLFADRDGLLWAFGEAGLWAYDTHSGRIDMSVVPKSIMPGSVRAMAQDADGLIWMGLDNDGILLVEKGVGERHIVNNPIDAYSLGNNSVTTMYIDDAGAMWVGTQKKGVSVCNDSEFKFDLEPFPDVNCVMSASTPGMVWVGTDKEGLILWNRMTDERRIIHDPADGSHHAAIACITPSRDGSVWAGTFTRGLKHYKNGAFRGYTVADGLANDNVWALLENPDGTLWVGTLGGGLQLLDPATGRFTTYDKATTGLESDYINSLCRGADGKIYAGTTAGVSVIDPVTKKIITFEGSRDGSKKFASPYISQLLFDSRGLLWLATREGLNVYDMKRDSVYDVAVFDDVPRPYILGVEEDAAHTMWVSVDGSLVNIKVENDFNNPGYRFEPRVYGGKDGLQNCTFNQRSLARLDNGDIVAGGLYGLNMVTPGSIHYNLRRPKVMFIGLSLLNEKIEPGRKYDGRIVLAEALNHTSKIELGYRQNSFAVTFATDNYVLPQYTTYYYKLEGFDKDWMECPPGMHHAAYTNIPPGTYRLVVKAINNDGVEGDAENTLTIVIDPPIWGTLWAKILYALLAIGAVIMVFYVVRRSERKRYTEKRREETARKQEELNQLKFRFYTNVSHELRTPLTLILSPIESMLKDTRDDKEKKRLNTIYSNANRLLYLVNQLLDFRKSEVAALTFNGSSGDVIEFLRTVYNQFGVAAEKKDIAMSFKTNVGHLDMVFDADKLSKTLNNLISNAMKFTPAGGSVTVDLTLTGKMLRIRVVDTGCGVPDEDKTQVFERFYQSRNSKGADGGSGIGLNLVKEYVRLHDGDVWVQDTPGGGATFTVDIPVREGPAPKLSMSGDAGKTDASALHTEPKAVKVSKPVALVVDDNHDLLDFMRDELSDDFNVITAGDGVEALELLHDKKVDIVVSDLMMPHMDGIELCRRMKADKATAGLPVILVTAKQDVQSVVEGLATGADDYVTKPFNNEVLLLKMKRLAGLRRRPVASRSLIEPEPEPVKITSLDEQFVDKAVKYVEENLSRSDLSVEELSRQLGMSRVHLYKKMLQLTGKTPIEFIRLLRLKRAAQYLRESQLNVSEIAYRMGFNNPKYFSKYFQEEYGMSPSEYQKKEGV